MSDFIAEEAPPARHASSLTQTLIAATLIQIVATASVLALTAIAPTVAKDLDIGAYWIGYQISLVSIGMVVTLTLLGILQPDQALQGFASNTPVCC